MPGPLHRIARLVRLGLAALVLAATVMPAHALPVRLPSALVLSVARLVRPYQQVEVAPSVRTAGGVARAPWEHLRASAPPPATRPVGPPRPLFLAHRALLR